MILYADIYVLINLTCDFISLRLCSQIMSFSCPLYRQLAGALFMSLYALVSVLLGASAVVGFLLDTAALAVGIYVTFGRMEFAVFVKTTVIFVTSCIVTGGIAGCIAGISDMNLIIAVCMTPMVCSAWKMSVKRLGRSKKTLCVTVDECRLSGLADSGNMLREAEKGLCVIVASAGKLRVGDERIVGWIKAETVSGVDYMPYYFPQSIEINKRKVRAAVALSGNVLSEYDCIVPTELA